MRSPLQQSAAALREQIVDLYTVPLIDANFPDGGGAECAARPPPAFAAGRRLRRGAAPRPAVPCEVLSNVDNLTVRT